MLHRNYSIWIQRNTTKEKNPEEGDWEVYIDETAYYYRHPHYFDSWGLCIRDTSPKTVYELAKMEIELYETRMLKCKLDKSVTEILKLDWRNNCHKQI